MVQVLPPGYSFGAEFGKALGSGVGSGLKKGVEIGLENRALKEKGIDLTGITDPHTRAQIIADELRYGRAKKKSESLTGLNVFGNDFSEKDLAKKKEEIHKLTEEIKSTEFKANRKDIGGLPTTSDRRKKELKEREERGPEGSIPEAATSPQRARILSAAEIDALGKIRQEKYNKQILETGSNMPFMTDEEARAPYKAANVENMEFNQYQDVEQQHRRNAQRDYGEIAEKQLLGYVPDANAETKAIFRRKAEDAARENRSDADIRKSISEDVRRFKNDIKNIEKQIPAARTLDWDKLLGNRREWNQEKSSLRQAISPLLELGLNDTARMKLKERGYAPEETESIITDLPESTMKIMAQLPNFRKFEPKRSISGPLGLVEYASGKALEHFSGEQKLSPEKKEILSNAMGEILKNDPNVNLILLRKEFEDKRIKWYEYKEALDQLVVKNGIIFNDDQKNAYNDNLNEPPLNRLSTILNLGGFIGR